MSWLFFGLLFIDWEYDTLVVFGVFRVDDILVFCFLGWRRCGGHVSGACLFVMEVTPKLA